MANFKILEINVSSAQDLPPVSKLLRTFAVAWVQPDQKLSTKIDYKGHTNPAWNYKLVFRIDDKFLRNEAAVITFEIYNVAWLRDLPIGTAYLFINQISPPLLQNSPVMRPVALHIRRPTGHLQGILHVGVTLINNNISGSPLRSELSAFTMENEYNVLQDDDPNLQEQHSTNDEREVEKGKAILQRQPSVHISAMPNDDDSSNLTDGNESQTQAKKMVKTKSYNSTNLSMATVMHPLPSEVAFHLKKGFYAPEGEEYGSSVFENWSEPSDRDRNPASLRSKSGKWQMEDQIPLTLENDIPKFYAHEARKSSRQKRKKNSSGGGLFSCFGSGCMFTFVYGSRTKNRQKIHRHEQLHGHKDAKMRRLYI